MNMKERFLAAIRCEDVDKIPCASPLQTGTVDLMERCNARWPEALRDPMKMATLSLAAYEIAGIESVRVPFDLWVEAETMGCEVSTGTLNSQPHINTPIIKNPDDVEKIDIPDPKANKPMANVLEAVKILKERVGDEVPVIGAAVDSFTLASGLLGSENMLIGLVQNPNFVKDILKLAEETAIAYTSALVDAGADIICLIDPSATGEMLGPKFHKEFAYPYNQRVIKEIHHSDTPVVLHICGNSKPIWEYMVKSGVDMLSLSENVDMTEARKKVGDGTALAGNIDPTSVLWLKKPEDVKSSVEKCIKDGVNDICPGCGFVPTTPLENMKMIVKARDRFSF